MTTFDGIMVAAWVVGTSAFGAYFTRYVSTTRDYLLAGRRLRWWQIGIAQSADAVDATDFVATTGQGFRTGLAQVGFAWWGMGIGSVLLSRYVAPLLYRTGVVTNAQYLELRFTASLRIASAILQVLYRFVAMALVVYAMATMFHVIVGIDLWLGVWTAMAFTLAYVLAAGQLGVVMAAVPQVLLMLVTSVIVLVSAFVEAGGASPRGRPSWAGSITRRRRLTKRHGRGPGPQLGTMRLRAAPREASQTCHRRRPVPRSGHGERGVIARQSFRAVACQHWLGLARVNARPETTRRAAVMGREQR